ncbi:MAG: KUP/HAK/KT family potassium transporter [Caulobacteraceae bacterium]
MKRAAPSASPGGSIDPTSALPPEGPPPFPAQGAPPPARRAHSHRRVYLLTIETEMTPTVDVGRRVELAELGEGLARVILHFGFMAEPDVPTALRLLADQGEDVGPMTTTYILSRQIVLPARGRRLDLGRGRLFAVMSRLAATPMTTFHLPVNRVIELGSQVEI